MERPTHYVSDRPHDRSASRALGDVHASDLVFSFSDAHRDEPSMNTSAVTVVGITDSGTVAALEREWNAVVSSAEPPKSLELDLSECEFIEVASLVFIVSRLVQRERASLVTTVRLPAARTVREFLRDWEFPRAISDATGRSFRSFVHEDDAKYFGERRRDATPTRTRDPQDLPGHVFPIQTFFAHSNEFGHSLAIQESRRWQERYVLAVLNNHLRGLGKRVATHIVHEAMMNAVRHPRASLLQTASHFNRPGRAGAGHLTIVVWDDGISIIDTLLNALRNDVALVPTDAPRLHRTIRLKIEGTEGEDDSEIILDSTMEPTITTQPQVLLLSSLFPGVTSDPKHALDAHPDVTNDTELFGLPGMGLYVLANTVIDVFGGELAVRTSDYFMNVRADDKRPAANGADFQLPPLRAKVRTFQNGGSGFLGNMLTVRLPTRRG